MLFLIGNFKLHVFVNLGKKYFCKLEKIKMHTKNINKFNILYNTLSVYIIYFLSIWWIYKTREKCLRSWRSNTGIYDIYTLELPPIYQDTDLITGRVCIIKNVYTHPYVGWYGINCRCIVHRQYRYYHRKLPKSRYNIYCNSL